MGELSHELTFRPLREGDLEFAVAQVWREGWQSSTEMFRVHLEHDPEGCFVAEVRGERVGMVTTTRYHDTAWVGNLIVLPEHRRAGWGSRLMQLAIEYLFAGGIGTIRLEADPPGVNIYKRLGFEEEFEAPRFRLDVRAAAAGRSTSTTSRAGDGRRDSGGSVHPPGIRNARGNNSKGARQYGTVEYSPIVEEDLDALVELDRQAFGDQRAAMLRLLHRTSAAAWKATSGGKTAGYLMVLPATGAGPAEPPGTPARQPTLGARFGPWIAADRETAEVLLRAALASLGSVAQQRGEQAGPGRIAADSIVVALPSANREGIELLEAHAFERTPSSIRMVRGPAVCPGRPEQVYAIGSGAFG